MLPGPNFGTQPTHNETINTATPQRIGEMVVHPVVEPAIPDAEHAIHINIEQPADQGQPVAVQHA